MLNYNIPDRKRKVTLQHFDLVWHEGPWEEERGGEGRRGRRCVCIGEKNPSCPLFLSRSHCLLFLISVYPVAWQADGSDYTVIINHGRKTMGETERWQRRRRRRRRGDLRSAHGPAHVSNAPVLISITLTAQTYIAPPGKKSRVWPPHQRTPFPQTRSLIAAWLDLIQHADVSHFEVSVLKDELILV